MFYSHPAEGEVKVKPGEPVDAAALIAEALKRKFAHRYRHDSERDDGEDFKLPVPDRKPQTETPAVRSTSRRWFCLTLIWLTSVSPVSVRAAHVEANWKKEVDLKRGASVAIKMELSVSPGGRLRHVFALLQVIMQLFVLRV